MNYAWNKLWPEHVPDRDLDIFEADSGTAWHSQNFFDDIVTIGQSMGLEVNADDIEGFFEDHRIDLTTEELKHLQNEHEKKI